MTTKIMFIDAHPDDMQAYAGGLLARLKEKSDFAGLEVSLTDGACGHYASKYLQNPAELIARRTAEANEAAAILGFNYKILTDAEGNMFRDGNLAVTNATKGAVWQAIRQFQPDLVITLPINNLSDDYGMHNDHTNVGEIVKRIAYLIPAPYAFTEFIQDDFPTVKPPHITPPIIVTIHDNYSGQIEPDLVIDITDVIDTKVESWSKHISQWQEWLPWIEQRPVPTNTKELKNTLLKNSRKIARKLGLKNRVYESFTITKWTLRVPTLTEIKQYFPGDVFAYELAKKKIEDLAD